MDKYLVFGNPIAQSRSPFIHSEFANQTNQLMSYDKSLAPIDGFKECIERFIASGGKGANVTAPFKEQAMELCHKLSARAERAGAVNTLSFVDGQILGDNTDGIGLVNDLKAHGVSLREAKVLILGAGGAVRGVILPLLAESPLQLDIANRTLSKAEALVDLFNDERLRALNFSETSKTTYDLIINATSASLSANLPDIPPETITSNSVCYDMVYGSKPTRFLEWSKKQGAIVCIDGLGMLVGQAAASFMLWRNVMPKSELVLSSLRDVLSREDT